MSRNETRWFCKKCGCVVDVKKAPVQHGLHLGLTLLTAGCWLPIWLLLWLFPFQKVCVECGELAEKQGVGHAEGSRPTTATPRRKRAA